MTTQDAPTGAVSRPGLARYTTAFLIVGVPVALLCVILFQLCDNVWFSAGSVLTYQAFIPLGALALAWNRRQELRKIITELALLFPDPEHPKRRGNEWLAVFGALVILLGVIISLPVVGLIGLLLLVIGIVFCIWGPFVLRGLAAPISYLVLSFIPPPVQGLVGPISSNFHFRSVAFAGYILRAMGRKPTILGPTLTLNGQSPLYVPSSFSGMGLLLGALAFTILVILWNRLKIGPAFLLLFTSVALALAANMLRVLMLVSLQNPSLLPEPLFLIFVCLPLWFAGGFLARQAAAQVREL